MASTSSNLGTMKFIGNYTGGLLIGTYITFPTFNGVISMNCNACTKNKTPCKLKKKINVFKFNKSMIVTHDSGTLYIPRVCYCNNHKSEYAKIIQRFWRNRQEDKKCVRNLVQNAIEKVVKQENE